MRFIDWIIIVILIGTLFFALFYFYLHNINQCTSNPLSYGAKKYSKDYGVNFQGIGYFDGLFGNSNIYFNSTGLYPQKN